MSQTPSSSAAPSSGALPVWITCLALGAALGGAATAVAMVSLGYERPGSSEAAVSPAGTGPAGGAMGAPSGAPSMGGMGGDMMGAMGGGMAGGMGGDMMGAMGGGMGGGMMGAMGGGMGGGAARGKRNLTALVGKLELLTRGNLSVELNDEQKTQLAERLSTLGTQPKMTAEEAQTQLEALEAMLTPEQKTAVDSISLPFNRSAGGASGGGGPGGGGMGGSMGGGGGLAEDENPFQQEQNKQRLEELRGRIAPANGSAATAP